MRPETIADVFRIALNRSPSEWKRGGTLTSAEIEALRATYHEWSVGGDDLQHPPNELWPLISHHDDVESNVVLRNFVARPIQPSRQSAKNPGDELVSHLMACNGVVLADPLRRIFFDIEGRRVNEPKSDDIHRVADRVGQLEPLLEHKLVRVSKIHPDLASAERQEFIAPFQLGTNMDTLTEIIAEGVWPSASRDEREAYPRKAHQLLRLCGIVEEPGTELFKPNIAPVDKLMQFARALMEVSWQLAHVTQTGADLYLTSPLEMKIFEVLLEDCADSLSDGGLVEFGPFEQGRHLQKLATLGLPALDLSGLEYKHLIDIRQGDAFTKWRESLNDALDKVKDKPFSVSAQKTAVAEFRTRMNLAAIELNADVKKRSLRSAVREVAATMPLMITATGGISALMTGSVTAAALGGTGASVATAGMIRYLYNRRRREDEAAIRFIAAFKAQ